MRAITYILVHSNETSTDVFFFGTIGEAREAMGKTFLRLKDSYSARLNNDEIASAIEGDNMAIWHDGHWNDAHDRLSVQERAIDIPNKNIIKP